MKNWLKVLIGVVIAVLIITVPVVISYNNLVSEKNNVEEQWGKVESKLQRRHDLIPNLVNSVQGSMKQEKEVFGDISKARSNLAGANTVNEKVEANQQMESALSRLLVVVENYPDLKSNENVRALMDELAGTENRISVERDRYNTAVKNYNNRVQRFPGNIIANLFGFEKYEYFKAAPGADKAPTVDFNN